MTADRSFALATAGVVLIAYTFVRLCQRFHHAGSVYGFVGATLGPRAGVVAGWALLGTYVCYGVVTSTTAGIFGAAALDALGLWTDQPPWAGFLIGVSALIGVLALAVAPVRGGTLVLLSIESATVALLSCSGAADARSAAAGRGPHKVAAWEVVIPALALLLIDYTLFRNVDPYPHGAARVYPVVSAAWIFLGVVGVWARPGAARRAGVLLTTSEGLGGRGPATRDAAPAAAVNGCTACTGHDRLMCDHLQRVALERDAGDECA